MSSPAHLRPVLHLRLNSHDRHSILFRLWQRCYAQSGRNVATAAVEAHAATLLMDCECDEGQKLRGAVRMWAGVPTMGRQPIRVRVCGGAPHVEGNGYQYVPKSKRPRRVRRGPGEAYTRGGYLRSTRRIVVGPEYVLYLAGWPTEVTGVEFRSAL